MDQQLRVVARGGVGSIFPQGKMREAPVKRSDTRDPNCPARDTTKFFGWAFTLDKHARLVGQHNAAY
jgi:hypothetical protein